MILDYTNLTDLKIVRKVRYNGVSADEIMNSLYKEARAFRANKVLIDDAGIGRSMIEHLKANFGNVRWEAFNFNTASKIQLMNDLNVALCNRILDIPDDDDIRDELVSFYYEENPLTKHVKMGGKGAHDDICIALALAVRATGLFGQNGSLGIGSNKGMLNGKNKNGISQARKCALF